MGAYILRRILLMIPTILGIMALSFAVVQFAPGGPIERVIAQLQGTDVAATDRFAGGSGDFSGQQQDAGGESESTGVYRGAQGLDPEFIAELERQFGFDKPPLERFGLMIWNYARFDFGESYFRDVAHQILDYFWHLTLPLIAMAVGAFATTTLLTKNSFLDEIRKQYVTTARAKGLDERTVLYGHVFRNAMLIIIAGFPGADRDDLLPRWAWSSRL